MEKEVILLRQPGRWLRSSHALKECVIAHWSSGAAPKIHGAKHDTEATGLIETKSILLNTLITVKTRNIEVKFLRRKRVKEIEVRSKLS